MMSRQEIVIFSVEIQCLADKLPVFFLFFFFFFSYLYLIRSPQSFEWPAPRNCRLCPIISLQCLQSSAIFYLIQKTILKSCKICRIFPNTFLPVLPWAIFSISCHDLASNSILFFTVPIMFGIERMWQFILIILKLYFLTYNVWLCGERILSQCYCG